MSSDPTFSVVTTTYRRPEYLAESLSSIASQTRLPDEVLVINNDLASASAVHDAIAQNFPDAVLIDNEENLGGARSKNVGIARAGGDVVAFLDDDDKWVPKFIASHAEVHARSHPDVVYSGFYAFWDDVPLRPKRFLGERPPADLFNELVRGRFTIGTSSVLSIRRSTLVNLGGFDDSLAGFVDWDLLCRIAADGVFEYIEEPLAYFRMHLGERGSHPTVRRSEFAEIREKWRDADGVEEMVARFTADGHYNASRYSVFAGDRVKGIRELWACVRNSGVAHLGSVALLKLTVLNVTGVRLYGRLQRLANRASRDP